MSHKKVSFLSWIFLLLAHLVSGTLIYAWKGEGMKTRLLIMGGAAGSAAAGEGRYPVEPGFTERRDAHQSN